MTEYSPVFLPFVLLLASGLGWRVQKALAERHRSRETAEAVRLILGMLVTFAAVVLGLLTSSAKDHFDAFGSNLQNYSIDLITMDQRLREYGPEAEPARALLRAYTAAAIADTWPSEPPPAGAYPTHPGRIAPDSDESVDLGTMLLNLDRRVAELNPGTPLQHSLAAIMATRMTRTLQDRWILVGSARVTLAWPFLSVMTGWLVLVFGVLGLNEPCNRVVNAVILLAALSLSVAVWLIVELDAPLSGLIHVPSTAMREALLHMDLPI